ncbi:hypothetical protein NCC78_22915 [Micromonospora phytophila]|uniref:hypothetical protein n=1 Tax=Micromonospora phytophila TaxID=709888 RepID=UPI00203052D0|nr:hypothetical protein [Micromonospora phytophila]MCM0677516.1 hypothetical protein [Micromonospora phytophila]
MAFRDKELRVPEPITLAGRRIKRYHIDQPERRLEAEVQRAAYDFLPRLLPPAGEDGTPAGSWVVLHRGADTGAYLLAWIRHVLAPDRPDLDGWVADTRAEGPVGS